MRKVEWILNCPNCGKEILDEDAPFCPSCGNSLELKAKRPDFLLAAGILTIIAAAFSAGLGYIALYQYNSLISYYGAELASEFLGFLIFGITDIVVSAIAIAGAVFMLKRKNIIFSMMGIILLLVAVIVTYVVVYQYNYGFTDTMLLSEISIMIFSIVSIISVLSSKKEFA